MNNVRPILIAALVVSLGFLFIVLKFPITSEKRQEISNFISGEDIPVEITQDYNGAKIPIAKLLRGCPNKDCIPSIGKPKFETVDEAGLWLEDGDMIFGLNYRGVVRAYPQRILNWHEIVNDEIEGDPIAVTFCPLSGTSTAFIRKFNGVTSDFGVSGYLYNSNLVMYDRKEGNLWQQINFEAIIGPAARRDNKLEWINVSNTTWGEWKVAHPDTEVLKKPAGVKKDYDKYPYGSYEENNEVRFGAVHFDKRLHAKDVIYGVEVGGVAKAYTEAKLGLAGSFEDVVGGEVVVVEKTEDNFLVVRNKISGEEYLTQRAFWFAWVIFNPNTLLY